MYLKSIHGDMVRYFASFSASFLKITWVNPKHRMSAYQKIAGSINLDHFKSTDSKQYYPVFYSLQGFKQLNCVKYAKMNLKVTTNRR